MKDIAKFTTETVQELDKLKGVRIERAKLGPCPVCGREITENRKGYSCWSREDPGCGFVIWKKKAGKILPVSVAKELIASLKASRERGEDPGVGRTEKAVTGFRGRSGRTFRAKLKLEQPTRASGGWSSTRSGPRSRRSEQAEAEAEAGRAAGGGQATSDAETAARAGWRPAARSGPGRRAVEGRLRASPKPSPSHPALRAPPASPLHRGRVTRRLQRHVAQHVLQPRRPSSSTHSTVPGQ